MNRFQSWYRIQPPALRALLTINVVAYALWQFLLIHIDATNAFVVRHLALHPDLPGLLFQPWQLVTYSFLHLSPGLGGFLHILFNMLWLFWIGKEYEELHGPHRLLAAYVYGALGGALLTVLLHELFPGAALFGGLVHGASAAVFGVMMTVAVLYPYKSIGLIFIGTVRLIYVVIGLLVLDLLFLAGSNTSISAHFGGVMAGFGLAVAERNGLNVSGWASIFFASRSRRRPARRGDDSFVRRMEGWMSARGEKREDGPARPANVRPMRSAAAEAPARAPQDEVDRILDKISAQGYEALTDDEKRILYEASRK